MAWYNSLKDLTGDIAKPVVATGHALGQVASNPWVQGLTAAGLAATGVGAPAAAAILAAQHGIGNLIKPGGNIKGALTGAAQGALTGGAAGLAGGALRGGIGLGSIGSGIGNVAGDIGSAIGKIPGGLGTLAGAAGKLLGGGSGGGGINLGSLADAGLGTAGMINASNLQNQSNKYATDAYNQAQDAYTSRAPLRTAGVAGMLNPSSGVDLSALRGAAGAGNPFSGAKKPPIALGSIGQPTGQA